MDPDAAREIKSLILARLPSAVEARSAADEHEAPWPWVAVGLRPTPAGARVAVRLQRERDRVLLPDLDRAAASLVDVEVIGPVRALPSPDDPLRSTPGELQRRGRPLRPGLSVAHDRVTAGTLGGFVHTASGLAVLSNNHVLAASNAARAGDAVLQPGPADHGTAADRVASLTAFEPMVTGGNLVDAAVAVLDAGVVVRPDDLPGGPLGATVPPGVDVEPEEPVEKVGRTTGHTRGRITAVEVDGVAVQYDDAVYRFDDQIEIVGRSGAFSAGGDSGSVIWRSRDRAPIALLFAGSETGGAGGTGVTFANPLATVLSTLGVEWRSA